MLEPQTHSTDSMIDLEILRDRRVIESKSCFWSMLQSYTEKLKLYYFDEELRIQISLSHLDEECIDDSDALVLLALIRNQATWLLDYITHNVELFATSILAFDEHHSVDTYEEEMTYLEDTYPFIDGHRLHTILNYVDGWSLDLQEENQEQKEEDFIPSPGRRRNSSRSINSTKSKRSSVRSESQQHNKGSLRNGSFGGFIFLQRLGIKSKSSSSWRIQHTIS